MVTDRLFVLFCQIQLDSCPWKEHKADTGRIYYHNAETKESTWTIPKELAELKGKLDRQSCQFLTRNFESSSIKFMHFD